MTGKEGMKFKIPIIDKKTKLEVRDRLIKGVYKVIIAVLRSAACLAVIVFWMLVKTSFVFTSCENVCAIY